MKSEMSRKADVFHPHTLVIHPDFETLRGFAFSPPERFEKNEGIVIHRGCNELGKTEYKSWEYVVKSFRRPNFTNRFVYGIFRPSKARRSYGHAELYRNIGVGTPQSVGYLNVRSDLLFGRSYYVSCLSACPYVYNDLFKQKSEHREDILRGIGRATTVPHEHGYAHKDYGCESILLQRTPEGIKLETVDLNRMLIGTIGIKAGCKDFERLPVTPQMHRRMAEEYAETRSFDVEKCFELMVAYRSIQPEKIDNLY